MLRGEMKRQWEEKLENECKERGGGGGGGEGMGG